MRTEMDAAIPTARRTESALHVVPTGAEAPRTLKVQAEIEQALKQLLERLEEWNDYQDVIQVTRALRDRQRDLQNRTEEAKGK